MKARFSLAVQASGDGTLGKLNNMLLVGEQEMDGDGLTSTPPCGSGSKAIAIHVPDAKEVY